MGILTDLRNRDADSILISCVDGLSGIADVIHAVLPLTEVQRCIVHQIRTSLKYIPWNDRKAFVTDLKRFYRAHTREEAETSRSALANSRATSMLSPCVVWPKILGQLTIRFEECMSLV